MTINTQRLREAAQRVIDDFGDAWYDAGDWKIMGDDRPPVVDEQFIEVATPMAVVGLIDALDAQTAETAEIAEARSQIDRWQRAAESAEDRAQAAANEIERLRKALTAIERWEVPLVESRGEAVSMYVEYGSNGVRDYFRGVARAALAQEGS